MNTPKVDLLKTSVLCAGLKAKLEAIDHPTLEGEKLFEVVAFHENKNLGEALQDLVVVKKRVCFIVPQGDRFESKKEGRSQVSDRFTSIDLLYADTAYTKGGNAAVFGGPNNVGVIAMNEITLEVIAKDPQLGGLRWCALQPTEGAKIEMAAADAKAASGREAWVQNYETPSGRIESPLHLAWTN
ncbi:MAG: hypothetical protein KF715_08635 [Candidatus Didemnitutus sp.]|nr:hypothetical protein [Candidatus Didemnitutus sp.]